MISDKAKSLIENLLGWSTAPEQGEYEYDPSGICIGGFAYVDIAQSELEHYIADLEAEVAELRAYRDGYNTNEKLPEEGQKVLVIKNGEYSTYNFSMHLWRSLLAPDFERWWPLPNGGGG